MGNMHTYAFGIKHFFYSINNSYSISALTKDYFVFPLGGKANSSGIGWNSFYRRILGNNKMIITD